MRTRTELGRLALSLALVAAAGCGDGEPAREPPVAPTPEVALAELRDSAAALAAREERDVGSVLVQHLLVSFQGAPGISGVDRGRAAAEALAAELFARARNGADFDELIREYSSDSPDGMYSLSRESRTGMVKGFGDVAWRLDVGEYGVAPYDPQTSPLGWHVMKRLR
jgi:hypothetical protein